MGIHCFTIVLDEEDVLTGEITDDLFEAGINGDDTMVVSRNGEVRIEFEREGIVLSAAVASAIEQVMDAGFCIARIDMGGSK